VATGGRGQGLVYARSEDRFTQNSHAPDTQKNRCEKPVFAVLTAANRSPRAVLGASVSVESTKDTRLPYMTIRLHRGDLPDLSRY